MNTSEWTNALIFYLYEDLSIINLVVNIALKAIYSHIYCVISRAWSAWPFLKSSIKLVLYKTKHFLLLQLHNKSTEQLLIKNVSTKHDSSHFCILLTVSNIERSNGKSKSGWWTIRSRAVGGRLHASNYSARSLTSSLHCTPLFAGPCCVEHNIRSQLLTEWWKNASHSLASFLKIKHFALLYPPDLYY